jgi:hypothetical protein
VSERTVEGAGGLPPARESVALVGLLLFAGSLDPAAGQAVRGYLRDIHTNQAIARGIVSLLECGGERVASVVTGADGSYRVTAPAAGCYLLEARRIGYQARSDGPLELGVGDEMDTELHLLPLPVPLAPLEVAGAPPQPDAFLARVGFYERQRSDFGHFITREQIEARAARRVTDLLSSVPGVRLVPAPGGLGRMGIQLRGSLLSHGGSCHPRVIIDEIIVIRGDARPRGLDAFGLPEAATETARPGAGRPEIALDDVVQPEDIQAVEVYRSGAEVPARFGGTSTTTQCGVIAIWTRRGRVERP